MKREQMPRLGEHQWRWEAGERWCSAHQGWVRAEEAHRQYNCPGVVHVCRECIILQDRRVKRIAPEPVVELRKVPPPPRLGGLWASIEEDGDDG